MNIDSLKLIKHFAETPTCHEKIITHAEVRVDVRELLERLSKTITAAVLMETANKDVMACVFLNIFY